MPFGQELKVLAIPWQIFAICRSCLYPLRNLSEGCKYPLTPCEKFTRGLSTKYGTFARGLSQLYTVTYLCAIPPKQVKFSLKLKNHEATDSNKN
jgi:hypothetical protein